MRSPTFQHIPSPLTQGRGLKRQLDDSGNLQQMSPLTQGRGLKHNGDRFFRPALLVAPHAGAWIETWVWSPKIHGKKVAPHAGAWIETWRRDGVSPRIKSPLTQGRGLKLVCCRAGHYAYVAPHAGAWIETPNMRAAQTTNGRRPSRRGVD